MKKNKKLLFVLLGTALFATFVVISCQKSDAISNNPTTEKNDRLSFVDTKEVHPYSQCISWMIINQNGDTICTPFGPMIPGTDPICWILFSMDPQDPCYDSPFNADMAVEIATDYNGNKWLRRLRFNTLSTIDNNLMTCLHNAVSDGSIYIHGGIEITTEPNSPIVNDMVPSGTYPVQMVNDTIDIIIL